MNLSVMSYIQQYLKCKMVDLNSRDETQVDMFRRYDKVEMNCEELTSLCKGKQCDEVIFMSPFTIYRDATA